MSSSLYRRLRRRLSPVHPRRVLWRLRLEAERLGDPWAALWFRGLAPRRVAATLRWAWRTLAEIRARRRERRLTVAVDVSPLWEPLTGIGWYLVRLIEHLAERDDLRLRLYAPTIVDYRVPAPVVELPRGPAIEVVRYSVPEDTSFLDHYLAHKLRDVQPWLIAADRNRVLFAPNYFLPRWFDRCRGALVATVHDLGVERVPETLREKTRRDLARNLRRTLGCAARVLTDSEAVRGELIEAGLAPPERVCAIPLGPGLTAAPSAPPPGTPERYVLHVGTLEPRKNVPLLLAAWEELERRGVEAPPLVLCGGFGWKVEELRRAMAPGLERGWLHHPGYVSDGEVAALYRDAAVVALPSIYEGFGLPAVEAMRAGVPLVCSDIPVLREVAGDAALYAPLGCPAAWADRLTEALTDVELRAELTRRGGERARRFDWRATAERTAAVWHRAAAEEKR